MKVKLLNKDPYGEVICRYFAQSHPKSIQPTTKQLLDILTIVLIGDKNVRYGPVPDPEQLVVVRKVIADAIAAGIPIPILVPWGGRKLDKALKLDIAELSALKQILDIDEMVRKYYPLGLQINVRIEDINAAWLYKDEEGIAEYSKGMQQMIKMFKGDALIQGLLESEIMNAGDYIAMATMYSKLLTDVILAQMENSDVDVLQLPSYLTLVEKGWKGRIPAEQRNYYLDRYQVMDPGKTRLEYARKLADYFAGSKVRYDLNGRGDAKHWANQFIQINFATPVPGAPLSIFNNTLYYRTVPTKDGRTHIAPWRSKGYLEIQPDNSVKMKVTNWGNKDVINELTETKICFDDVVVLNADYIVKEYDLPPVMPIQ